MYVCLYVYEICGKTSSEHVDLPWHPCIASRNLFCYQLFLQGSRPLRVIGRRRVLPLKIKAFHSRCFSTLWALSGTCASGRVTNLDLLKTFGFRSTIADRIWEHQSSHFWPFLQVARGKVAAQRSGFTSVDWTVANGGFLHPDSNCQVYGAVLRSCRMQGCLGLRGMVCLIGVPKGLAM